MVMFFALMVFVLFFYNRELEMERDGIHTVMRNSASVRGNFIEIWNRERVSDSKTILRTVPGSAEMGRLIEDPGNTGLKSALRDKFNIYIEEYKYSNILLVQRSGNVIYSHLDTQKTLNAVTVDKINLFLSGDKPTANELYYCSLHKTYHLDLFVALATGEGNRNGVLILRMDPQKYLFPILKYGAMKLGSLQNLLLKRAGNKVEVLSPLGINNEPVREIPVEEINSVEVLAAYGKRGYIEGVDHQGNEVVAYMMDVPSTDWVIISKLEQAEAFAELDILRWLLVGLAIVVFTIAMVTTFLITGVKEKRIIRDLESNDVKLRDTQEALRGEVSRVVTLMGNINGMVLRYTDQHTRTPLFVSEGAIELTGYTPEEFFAEPTLLREIIRSDEKEEVEEAIDTALLRREKFDLSYRITTRSGKLKWVLEKGGAVYDKNDEMLYIESVVIDNDERVRALLLSQENEEKFRLMISNSPGLTIVMEKDGTISYASPQSETVLKYTPEYLVKKNFFDLIDKKDRESALDIILEAISNRRMVEGEYRFLNGNGETIRVNHIASPLVIDGEVREVYNKINDITARRRADESIALFKKSVDQSPAIVLIADRNGVIEYSNKTLEVSTGFNHDEYTAVAPAITSGVESDPYMYKEVWSRQLAGKEWHGEIQCNKKNGEQLWYEQSIYPIIDENGEIHHYVSTLIDATAKRKLIDNLIAAKERAEEMSALKTNFLANMSHELRTPLIAIMGFAEILIEEGGDELQKEMAEQVFRGGQRLSNTLNLLLTFASLESSKMTPIFSEIDIIKETGPMLKEMKEAAEKKGLYLKCDSPPEGLMAVADSKFIIEMVRNLVDNAIKFTRSGGVTVEFGKAGDPGSYIKVIDTGIGIRKDDIHLIFEEFRQASEGYSRAYEGVGLGLTLVKRMLDILGGELKVDSVPGEGSVFTLLLPERRQV